MPDRLEVRERILLCEACELCKVGSGPVPFSGPTPAYMAVVGEGPGAREDEQGEPFVGPSGVLLRECLAEVGIAPELLFYCNATCCRPADKVTSAHVHACSTNLSMQIELANPTWVLLLGNIALSTIRPDLRISRARGHVFQQDGRMCFATFHPSHALRDPRGEKVFRQDLVTLAAMVDAHDTVDDQGHSVPGWIPFADDSCLGCGITVEDMGEHDMSVMFDGTGGSYCSECWKTRAPEGKAEVRAEKKVVRFQERTGQLFQ